MGEKFATPARVDHVSIAVPRIAEALEFFRRHFPIVMGYEPLPGYSSDFNWCDFYLGNFKLLGLESVKPTGRSFEVMQIHMSRVRNGKTVEHWGARDDLGMLRQLGVLPASVAP